MMDWWYDLVFAEPWLLWLLLAVPVTGVLIYLFAGKGRPVLSLSSFRYLHGVQAPGKVKWRSVLYILRLLAIVLLITAFARPQSRKPVKRKHGQGIDIILTIDISSSMEATDFYPTRLEAAKQTAIQFVEARPNDRIGVVIFASESFSLCPLTTDHEVLKPMIANIQSGELEDGTDIGTGLAKGVERIKDSKAKSKVVVLLTDGKNENPGIISPVDAARMAKTFNVKVYTIGLGSEEGNVLTPTMKNPDGSYVSDYVPVNIDEKTLIEAAEISGGKYFRAGDEHKLGQIYNEIDKLEKSEFDKKGTEQRKEEFLPFLLVALGLLLLEFILRYTVFDSLT